MEKEFNQKQKRLLSILAICSDVGHYSEKELCFTAKLIYTMILISCDENGICKKRNSTFGQKLGISRPAISKHTKKLKNLGLIEIKRKSTQYSKIKWYRELKIVDNVITLRQKMLNKHNSIYKYIDKPRFNIHKFLDL